MDAMHDWTDKRLNKLEKRLRVHYRKANVELTKKLSEHLKQFEAEDKRRYKLFKRGVISKKEYYGWREREIMLSEQWRRMRDQLAYNYLHVNEIAYSMVTDELPDILSENRNYAMYSINKQVGMGVSFTLTDEETVRWLLEERPNLIPEVYAAKDTAWNRKKIASAVTQGILQGESMDRIAKRLTRVTSMNEKAAIRNARTCVTAAENYGRWSGYKKARDMGIRLKKQWVATLDGRTRHTHREIDGEIVGIDETFDNGCQFPGDPLGAPGETFNCRCTMIAAVEGHEIDLGERDLSDEYLDYEDWKSALM